MGPRAGMDGGEKSRPYWDSIAGPSYLQRVVSNIKTNEKLISFEKKKFEMLDKEGSAEKDEDLLHLTSLFLHIKSLKKNSPTLEISGENNPGTGRNGEFRTSSSPVTVSKFNFRKEAMAYSNLDYVFSIWLYGMKLEQFLNTSSVRRGDNPVLIFE